MNNRELKFRALCEYETINETLTKMVYFGLPEMDNGLWAFPIDNQIRHINAYESPLMQYTGLKDKNDKEIYDGDIIRQGGNLCIVQSCVGGFDCQMLLELKNGGTIEGSTYNFSFLSEKYCEIIGNIYENTELLTQ